MKETWITCTVCPNSCRILVTEDEQGRAFRGYKCRRGLEHARNEMVCPMRMLTSTMAIEGASLRCVPVISSGEIPKDRLYDCLSQVYAGKVTAPVSAGQVLIGDICGLGVNIVAARTMKVRA